MRVAILGAGGTIAPVIVRDLARSDEVEGLRLLDLDAARAEAVADGFGEGKATAAGVDARDDGSLARAIDGCDVVVNSASYRVNLDAMRACLAAGAHYIDLGGLYWMTGRQLELHPEFERAGLLALLGIGSSPGKTNVMARAGARLLGDEWKLDEAHVYAAGRRLDPGAPLAAPYAIQTLKDELEMKPVCVRDGQAVEVDPMTPSGRRDFGDPIGEGDLIHTIHSEIRTFPDSFGVREATFNLSLPPALLGHLDEVTETIPPDAPSVSVHMVDCVRDGRRILMRAVTEGSVNSTAAPAAAAVRLMARGAIDASGALPAERCVDPDDLFPELEQRGCVFAEVTT
jgi:saccharopine dehydrogenase (NAD+, L-lysine-forming)